MRVLSHRQTPLQPAPAYWLALGTLPILFLVFFLLAPALRLMLEGQGTFTPKIITALWQDNYLRWRLLWSLLQAGATCVLVLAIGLPVAWVLARLQFAGRALVLRLLMLPFIVPTLVAAQQQRFIERFTEALKQADSGPSTGGQLSATAAQERALTEAAAFAIRIDVAEELTRLHAHLDEIDDLLTGKSRGGAKAKGQAPAPTELGKRLDFIIQELHREANTLGSKSSTLELSRISVDMKVLIEQMREQVQNIE